MEVPAGFEPAVEDLQSFALPTWLRNRSEQGTGIGPVRRLDEGDVDTVFLDAKE